MQHVATTCKFCKTPITLDIADEYDSVKDPHGLIVMACCNPCADIRVLRRKLETKVSLTVRSLQLLAPSDDEQRKHLRDVLVKRTQDYAKLICKWHRMDGMIWDEGVVDAIMKAPHQFGETLSRMWTAFKQWKKQQEQEEMNLAGLGAQQQTKE